MKRFLFYIILSLLVLTSLMANPVDQEMAKLIATNFWSQNNEAMPEVTLDEVTNDFQNLYIFSTGDRLGFVIVSADDRVVPIIGYSFTNPVSKDSLPDNLRNWLIGTGDQIAWMIKENIEPSPVVTSQWRRLATPLTADAPAIVNTVNPLLTTTWNQFSYYNSQCPYDGSYRSVTGCTATATAQVMKYWNHPTTGHGSHSYTWNSQTLSANFGNTTYQWYNMPSALTSNSTSTEINAVATLMYHIGVGCEMNYSANGSSASTISYGYPDLACAENALRDYFYYDWGITSIQRKNFTDAAWKQILKDELDQLRPVIYTGYDSESGHAFVCDGYNSSDQFHFNWGWGGLYDGFYAIGNLNPGSGTGGSSSGTYDLNNSAIINIQPSTSTSSTSTVSYSVNNTAYGSVGIQGSATMTNYDDPTYLIAESNEGYRFTGWSDNSIYNPRGLVGNGGTLTLTANFEPCGGDTLYYCKSGYKASYGTGSTTSTQWWGVRFPASQLRSGKTLKKVMLFSSGSGSYTLHVYKGGTTSPQTEIHTQTANISGTGWKTITLSSALSIDSTESLWVVFSTTGIDYPMSITEYAGNDDTNWYGGTRGTSWSTLTSSGYYYSFMIKAIVDTKSGSYYTLTGNTTPSSSGYVEGAGEYGAGETATIFAKANTGYKFTGWEDGSMDQPRTIVMSSNKTVNASFASLAGDTMTFSVNDKHLQSVGTSSKYDIYWAVRFDKSVLRQGQKVVAVQLYDVSSENTSMYLYQGGDNAPQTRVKTCSNITTTNRKAYNTYNLPNAYEIDKNKSLWVVFKNENSSSHPCAYTHYSGSNDGCFISLGDNTSWKPLSNYDIYGSWMIKLITTTGSAAGTEELVLYSNNVYTSGLDINVVTDKESVSVSICDLTGKVIIADTQNATLGRYTMPVSGIYFVTIDGVHIVKVVVR